MKWCMHCKVMAKLNLFTACHHTKLTFRIYSLGSFQICPTVLLTTMLYIMSAWLILWWQVCISWPPSPILFTPQSFSPLVCYIWLLLRWIMFPLYPLCWEFFFINGCFIFFKWFFWIYWDDHMIYILLYVNRVYHGDRCVDVELSLHSWTISHLIIVYEPFNRLLNLVC